MNNKPDNSGVLTDVNTMDHKLDKSGLLSKLKNKHKEIFAGYMFILPALIFIFIFSILPIFMSFYYGFTRYNIQRSPIWIGFDNYRRMLTDPFVAAAFRNTFMYTIITVPAQTIIALVLAAIIASQFRNFYGNIVRSALFIPVISSTILVGTIWTLLLHTSDGAVNFILGFFGIDNINWLGQSTPALYGVSIATVWRVIGYYLVIFYAGIMGIDQTLYEAAEVDGATKIRQFLHITIPGLMPVISLVVILGTIWAFQIFDIVFVMTGGGPGRATLSVVQTIYNAAFREHSLGYASAISMVLFIVIMVVYGIQARFFKERG